MAEFRTLTLAKIYYSLGSRHSLPSHLRDQFLRSSSSISLNLVEGNAKTSLRDRLRIFEIAYGSFRESQTILEIAAIDNKELLVTGDELGANLYKLIQALKKKIEQQRHVDNAGAMKC
ncbi:four helix bundle protein [Bdellovibrio sp. BCCA]|uniref:four helix bundle protein n=1 Tax=Bdellovibrio sp. BCCA TaxID=3136281 RepID=UPI0030F0B980